MVSWGPGLSALVGAGATLIAGLLVYWKRRRDIRTNLRIALEHEIEGMQDSLNGFASLIDSDNVPHDDIIPETNFVTTVVYQNNTHHLGLLSDPEVDAITEFYNDAIQLGRAIDMLVEHKNPVKTATYHGWFRENNLLDVLEESENALLELRKRL